VIGAEVFDALPNTVVVLDSDKYACFSRVSMQRPVKLNVAYLYCLRQHSLYRHLS